MLRSVRLAAVPISSLELRCSPFHSCSMPSHLNGHQWMSKLTHLSLVLLRPSVVSRTVGRSELEVKGHRVGKRAWNVLNQKLDRIANLCSSPDYSTSANWSRYTNWFPGLGYNSPTSAISRTRVQCRVAQH
nr:hypothetical protein CFP56_09401 [Quercus suber]